MLRRRGSIASALNPGQPGQSPAAEVPALGAGILVALKTFEHIVAVWETGLRGGFGGGIGSVPAAADEQEQRFAIDGVLQLGNELRITMVARIGLPLDFDRAGNAPDPVEFGARADVNQAGARSQPQHLVSLLRRHRALEGKAEFACAVLGELQYFGDPAHVVGEMPELYN